MQVRNNPRSGSFTWLVALALAIAGIAPAAFGQNSLFERIQSSLDEVARGLDYVGRKAEDLIGPGLGLGETKPAAFTERRQFSERYPTGPSPVVSVSNEFGQIRVETWSERVVQVQAEILAGANDASLAAQLTREINVNVTSGENLIEVRTYHPPTRNDLGTINVGVNYLITVPRDAGIITDNFFGDTAIDGVNGLVAVESQYGQLELSNLGGTVKVRAHGELPMVVRNLAQGGVFQLHGTQAEILGVGGELVVSSHRGFLRVGELQREAALDLYNESGMIEILLEKDETPDITATLIYSELQSSVPLQKTEQGKKMVARRYGGNSGQQVLVSSAFGTVHIDQPQAPSETPETADASGKPFKDTVSHEAPAAAGTTLHIDAAVGNVLVQPALDDRVQATATRIVWLPAAARAQEALETLDVSLKEENGVLLLRSVATEDMAAFSGSAYRVDLQVLCPPGVNVEINAPNGQTRVQGLGAKLTINQQEGAIAIVDVQGEVNATNQKGGISIQNAQGPVTASLHYGALELRHVGGPIRAECIEGRSVVEEAANSVYLRNSGEDVAIIALEKLGGAFDVEAKDGNIRMVMSPESNAALFLQAREGRVDSSIPLTGRIDRTIQEFQGRLGEGAHDVRLTADNGSITLD
ncbi:MAG: hypothetical protein HYV27_13340 [Candidatus Hydrogenedentes bacterium]|nr:hypothetical protein [Candidatus Hydrogenedentota bacterium]